MMKQALRQILILFSLGLLSHAKIHDIGMFDNDIEQFDLRPRGIASILAAADASFSFDSVTDETPELPIGWSSCSQPTDLFHLRLLSITPDPPKRSTPLQIHVAGHLDRTLIGGMVNYTVKYGIIPVATESVGLCDLLKMEPGVPQCPIKKGDWDVKHEVKVPGEVPFGRYSVEAAAWDSEGRQIFCLQGSTTIGLFANQVDGDDEEYDKEYNFDRDVMRQIKI